ncbi:CoF synthetase [Paenibacillus sp. TAB 01]|uniref:CoF synthetase n=1 Tax=Paenibacillus sp. TAB 01 TaxID=3368988 RepID=UPI0037511089
MHELSDLWQAVERIKRNFPWYAELSGRLQGNTAADLRWSSLPLVTSSLLEKHYYTEHQPLALRPDVHCYKTSGTSSGRRKSICYSPADEDAYVRIKLDVFRSILGDCGFRRALSDMGTGHAEATAVEVFRRLGMEVESVSFRLPIEHHLERLAAFRPEVLYTMPSILERILLASSDPASYGIRHVILVGEIASPAWKERAAQKLGLGAERITDTYGSIEIGTIAYYDHSLGRYVFAEGLFAEGIAAEALDGNFEPLPEEERVLVLTSTVREAFPAVRYVTYDVVRDLRTTDVDGVPRQSFHSVVKRIGPDLKHGEKISIYDIEDVVFRYVKEASVRVRINGNALALHIYGPPLSAAVLAGIRHDVENRIPEIGIMIRSGILDGIQVVGETFDDAEHRGSVKSKKIAYEDADSINGQGGSA